MNPSTATATVIVDELVRCGVTEVVLCPGSRSAPLAYAVHAAERAGRLRAHVRVDERSAGFLALGLGKLSRRPAVVVTTSGTAVANLHPAVLEAFHGRVPLIVLTADRPSELRGTGANQTTTQPGIFAGAVRWQADVPAGCGRPGEAAAWRTAVDRAWAAATGCTQAWGIGDHGPVHLNVAFRDPLAPDLPAEAGDAAAAAALADPANAADPADPAALADPALAGRPHDRPWTLSAASTARAGHYTGSAVPVAWARAARHGAPEEDRTLLVLGDLPDAGWARHPLRLAALRGWPVVAEPFGIGDRAGVLPHGPLVLADPGWVREHRPDRVLVVGRVTLSRDLARLFREPGVRVETVSAVEEWTDPGHVAAEVHPWVELLTALDETETEAGGRDDDGLPVPTVGPWARAWVDAGHRLQQAVAAHLPQDWPSGPSVARAVLDGLDPADVLVLGSSNPARDVDLAMRPEDHVLVIAGRGLAGIDGTVSTAAGVALTADLHPRARRRTVALMGDLTFLHDANGLLVGPGEPRPDLTVVVVNDDGGGIFATLDYGHPDRADAFERFFTTPTGTDLAALCRAHGVGHTAVDSAAGLTAAVRATGRGIRVVEVRVPPGGHRRGRQALRDLAAEAVRGEALTRPARPR